MSMQFECLENYKNSLEEVSLILKMAIEFKEENNKYAALNKSAILLLTAKFENFIETAVEEYNYFINEMKLSNSRVPEWLRVGHTVGIVEKLLDVINKKENSKKIKLFEEISVIWDNNQTTKMKVSNKFNYGKHGANELIKLFNNIGIEDIFKEIKITSLEESILEDNIEHDFKGTFNNVINKRNFVTHQDANPNLTHQETEAYKQYFEVFAEKLCEYLQQQLSTLKIIMEAETEVAVSRQQPS